MSSARNIPTREEVVLGEVRDLRRRYLACIAWKVVRAKRDGNAAELTVALDALDSAARHEEEPDLLTKEYAAARKSGGTVSSESAARFAVFEQEWLAAEERRTIAAEKKQKAQDNPRFYTCRGWPEGSCETPLGKNNQTGYCYSCAQYKSADEGRTSLTQVTKALGLSQNKQEPSEDLPERELEPIRETPLQREVYRQLRSNGGIIRIESGNGK
jgi:hypothetical protein